MTPARAKPSPIWSTPASTTDSRKASNDPSDVMAVRTMTARPAAGPLTPSADPDAAPTTVPPTMPAMMPEKSGAPDASAIPRQSGVATRNTTTLAGRSAFSLSISAELLIRGSGGAVCLVMTPDDDTEIVQSGK